MPERLWGRPPQTPSIAYEPPGQHLSEGWLLESGSRTADGKSIHYDIAVAIEIDSDGMIRRWNDYYDLQSIVNQLRS